ncbi:MAG: lipocalin family protein [Cytophagaceae bacterium]
MKRILLPILILVFALSSCKKDKAELITGEWQATELELAGNNLDPKDIGGISYSFSKDGKFEYVEAGQTEEGNYAISQDGNKLNLNYEGNRSVEKEIIELSNETLVISGEEHGMSRKITLKKAH